ncbi:MAG: benzoate/H(+) symporter BenE family transporter [Solirubrobacteraceae bacterium]
MERWHVASSGAVVALVGFASSAMVVIAGLGAVGASPAQAASGLAALCVVQGVATIALSHRHRIPVLIVWSTPGAALLAGTGHVDGGWAAAVGAFVVVGLLIILTGLWPRLGRLIAAIPTPIAQAMLAGVLLEIVLTPVHGVIDHPALMLPPVLVWLALIRLAPRFAVPAAFAAAMITIGLWLSRHGGLHGDLLPRVDLTTPAFSMSALLTIALPLWLVTMASQNVPGVAVLASFGYEAPWRPSMLATGVGTVAGAFAGGHAVNLAALTAALAAAPEAHPDPRQRYRVAAAAGWFFLPIALASAAITAVVAIAPAGVAVGVAGLALISVLAASLTAAMEAPDGRIAAAVTFIVAASGIEAAGIGAAFWALLAGLAVHLTLTIRR